MHHIHIHALPNTLVCIDAPYTHTCTTKHTCVHRCNIHTYMQHQTQMCAKMHQIHIHAPHATPNTFVCIDAPYTHVQHMNTCSPHAPLKTYVHHQTPPKIKIYLVSIPSALYERPGQNERCVLNSALLLLFRCFSYEKHILGAFHEKCRCFHEKHTFHKIQVLFMKSADIFHKKCMLFMCFSKDHLQGIVTLCL